MTRASSRLRVAIVGAGWWGAQHARVFAARSDVELCAIAARTAAHAEDRARRYGARAYTDVQEMLAAVQPDFVSVVLSPTQHFDVTRVVIRHGTAVLAEKPLVFETDEADILLREAHEGDLFFAICFNHRYAAPVRMAKRAIDTGRLGDITFATWRFGGEGCSAHHPFANLIETQCHGFDLVEHLCGPISDLSAEMTDRAAPGAGYGTIVAAMRFASGAVGSLIGTYDSSYTYPQASRVEIDGTAGRVVIEDTVRRFTFTPVGSETSEVWQAGFFKRP